MQPRPEFVRIVVNFLDAQSLGRVITACMSALHSTR